MTEPIYALKEPAHSQTFLLQVIWKRLYNTQSCTDFGTLYQLRNLINRRNVSTGEFDETTWMMSDASRRTDIYSFCQQMIDDYVVCG